PWARNRTPGPQAYLSLGEVPVGVTNFAPNPPHASVVAGGEFADGLVRRITITGSGGPNAQFGPVTGIQVQTTLEPSLAHQPDGTAAIDAVDARFGSTVCQVGDLILGVRSLRIFGGVDNWDAVRLTVLSDSRNAVVTEATYGRPGFDYIDPSVAMNAYGDIVIGFTRSSSALGSGINDGRLGAYAV